MQLIQRHGHKTMHEVFYVESGSGFFVINDEPLRVNEGHVIHIAPGVMHSVLNSPNGSAEPDLVLLYLGLDTADDS